MFGIIAAVECGDKVYFSHPVLNGLYSIEKSTGKVRFICLFEEESYKTPNLHRRAVCDDRNILFLPHNAKNIAIYNIEKSKIDYMDPRQYIPDVNPINYQVAFRWKNEIRVLIASKNECAWIINPDNRKMLLDRELSSALAAEQVQTAMCIGSKIIVKRNKMFYLSGCDNRIFQYDMNTKEYSSRPIGEKNLGALIADDGCGNIWFAYRGMEGIVTLNSETGEYKIYDVFPVGFDCLEGVQPFLAMYFIGKDILFIPARANSFIVLDRESGNMRILAKVNNIIPESEDMQIFPFSYSYTTDKTITVLLSNNRSAIIINKRDLSVDFVNTMKDMDEESLKNRIEIVQKEDVVKESKWLKLEDFVSGVLFC